MALVTFKNLYFSVGQFPLLDHVNENIESNERIALIGRNGQGKSTLFKILAQQQTPDGGEVIKADYVKIAILPQELPPLEPISVFEFVAKGLSGLSDILVEYHALIEQTDNHDDNWMKKIGHCQTQLDHLGGWLIQERIERVIQDLGLPASKLVSELSGGWRRRVALAQALVQEPDILLLDEPTNHLDLEAIEWLEKMLLAYPKTIMFITHDRALLRKLATRIIELDRGQIISYPPDYDGFLARKEQALLEEERQNALFDKKLSEEEQWLRQGVKARRTRNEGRVRALKTLREVRQTRRTLQGKPSFEVNDANVKSGKTMIQAKNLSFGYTEKSLLIKDFTFTIQRGDKIAIVGPNGVGKTTLVKLLLGLIEPTQGEVKQSPTMQVAFFDQTRDSLDKTQTVMANVANGDDIIPINGKNKHVIGYLGDFLFSPQKCRATADTLSGGEQNRLLLAKLFAKPANVLVLDEPTNDLDIESLDVLEELLLEYSGTVIIISHDREFIDNIATYTIAFEESGDVTINVGGYTDWLERKKAIAANKNSQLKKDKNKTNKPAAVMKSDTQKPKLSFMQQKELNELPAKVEKLEADILGLEQRMAQPEFYQQPQADIQKITTQIQTLKKQAELAYLRWQELDS
jgi:ATP-binding cassette subfamily F protein uup